EGVEDELARLGGHAYTLEAARRLTCAGLDLGEKPAVVSAIMKYQSMERMRAAVNSAMDIHAGKAISEGPRNYLANLYRAVPIGITVEGANILTRSLIVFGQGAMRCHPYLMREIELAGHVEIDREHAENAFDAVLVNHTRHIVGNALRALWHGLTFAVTARAPATPAARWYRQLTRLSAAFALVADATLALLGGELKRREKLSGRFADILGELYFASAVLKRWEDEGRPEPDRALVDYSLAQSVHTIEQRLSEILSNFPVPALGVLLRLVVLPLGRRQHAPADKLGHRVASLLMKPSPTFARLSTGLYLSRDRHEATGALEYAFLRVDDTEAIARKLHDAVKNGTLREETPEAGLRAGVLTPGEAQLLQEALEAVNEVIRVDEFAWQEMTGVSQERRIHAA
ncbi:MAG: fadE, partial [Moraxellaceae bacterium]|nr:fadE [Moraxellaceae bacterium]